LGVEKEYIEMLKSIYINKDQTGKHKDTYKKKGKEEAHN
jgi:hypothetical protein